MKKSQKKSGQAMVEYIIIVVLVALAALAVFAVFSDTIRAKLAGAVVEMDSGSHASAATAAASRDSQSVLKDLDKEGLR